MSEPAEPFLDALHGWLVLLPLAVLCAPPGYSLFDGAPDTVSVGVAASALGILPALLMALARGRGVGAAPMAPLWVTLISAAVLLPQATDTFGAWRSLLGLTAAAGFVSAGASLRPSGRRALQRGLGVLALLLLLASPMGPAWTGALGNTGDLSEAALPCAILGAGVFLTAEGPLAFGGFAAILLYSLYAGHVPVYAGLASLGFIVVVAAIGAIVGRHGGELGRKGAAKRLRILLVALLVGLVPMAYATLAAAPAGGSGDDQTGSSAGSPAGSAAGAATDLTASAADASAAGSTTGGFAFRQLTWASVPAMLQDHLVFGVGPGQFQAAFPPYRSQEEILLSSYERREPTPIEVEHAHNDWLTAVAEHGPVGGGAFVLFLLIVLVRALRATWGPDRSRRDFGFAAIAVLANALFNAPLLYGPAAPAIAFAVFGVVCGQRDDAPEVEAGQEASKVARAAPYALPGLALVALALLAPRALSLFEYGRALAETPSARVVGADGRESLDADRLGGILDRALSAEPLSPVALEKKAQLLSRTGAPAAARREVLDAWTTARPQSFAAHLAMGVLRAQESDFFGALESFERGYAVDPTHPAVLENRLRAACDLRDAELAELALTEFANSGHLDAEKLRSLSIEQLMTGRLEVAVPLVRRMTSTASLSAEEASDEDLRRADLENETVDALDMNATYAARKRAKEAGDNLLADAYNVAFQMLTALDFLKRGFPTQAATSAHQALKSGRDHGLDIGPILLRKAAAKAAASVMDGNADSPAGEALRVEAAGVLEAAPIRSQDRAALSEIERDALRRAGLLGGGTAVERR